ncbi:MAG: MBL fold metallo-hydrolase [Gemmatimonadales bacterium]
MASYRQATAILEQAATAFGGRERLLQLRTVSVKREGWWFLRNQSRNTGAAPDSIPQGDEWQLDLVQNRASYEVHSGAQGIGRFSTRGFVAGDDRASLNLSRKTVTRGSSAPLATPDQLVYYWPPLVVRRALQRAAAAKYLGEVTIAGKRQAAISVNWQDRTDLTLYFDRATGLLTKTDRLAPDYELGDSVQEYWYDGYRPVSGIQVPEWSRAGVGGRVVLGLRTAAAAFDAPLDTLLLAVPAEFRPVAPPPPPALIRAGEGVWYYVDGRAGYNVTIAETSNHLVVFEAPVGNAYSSAVLASLRDSIPGKPVRFVILSHHHWDHVAGIPAYVAEGATVVTTGLAEPLVRRILDARPTLAPDPLRGRTVNPVIVTVPPAGRRVLSDGRDSVVVIAAGPTPHVDAMLAVYMPRPRLLAVGDWVTADRDGPVDRDSPATQDFVQWLRRARLVVDAVLDVHGRRVATTELTGR